MKHILASFETILFGKQYNNISTSLFTMDNLIRNLPPYLGKEIFSYLIPNANDIVFVKYESNHTYDYYNSKYEKGYLNNRLCQNNNYYLSRISKKNGKHRYYISQQFEDVLETEFNERIYNLYMYEYKSVYVGKNLEIALLELFVCS
jgi:hypothetical protein